jgi:hypothetical protein
VHKLKSHKTVEQIAKKHRLNVSFVKKQLEMGIPIEHEHTGDKDLATDIALQHLDEIPDYYTRLKKMESSAKKEHKKFKDVHEHCGCEGNAVKELESELETLSNTSYNSIDKLMHRIMSKHDMTAKQLHNAFVSKHDKAPDTWIKERSTMKESKKSLRTSNPCWKGYKPVGTKKKRGRTVPNCVPIKEASGMMRYCPKCKKDETRDECKYGSKYWDMFSLPSKLSDVAMSNPHYHANNPHPGNFPESYDHEHSMARSELSTIVSAAKRLRGKLKGEGNIEAWVQSKITKAADYLDSAADYVDSGEMKEQMLPPIDPEAHKKAQRTQKLFNKGQKTNNPHEQEIFLNRTGPQLPLAKAKSTIQVAHYEPDLKTFEQFINEAKKSEMKCNSPKPEPVGDSLTGKSHVVKACEGGKEKLIRFGQRGVKGSPKKKGESKEYASRRHRFQTRHAKNIAKGKMSAAYWANKVKW